MRSITITAFVIMAALAMISSVMSCTRVYIGGLAVQIDEYRLRQIFERFGDVKDATFPKDRNTGMSRGFGFVTYSKEEDAQNAINTMNGQEVEGRSIK
ncbi:hypothetical protein BGZ91_002952, partial [Linnemannia elongata]